MSDTLTETQRHKCMAAIGSKDTKPEIMVRRYLHANGFRYRVNVKDLPGTPDIVLPKYRTVIFVNGCFWHRHTCRYAALPKTRTEFWRKKIEGNRQRDKKIARQLRKDGWTVITVWQCRLKADKREKTLENLVNQVRRCL